ncbi:hypothetical protein ACEWY4_024254 [Coilia grayii]|uniref:Transmembrane protein 200B n=1 Tax=Coilia grayii TaxID=363190 RepID=A0ABD1J1I5_9TELE
MKTQTTNPAGPAPTSPTHQRLSRFRLRSRKKKEGVIQGKLRIKSLPGAFLMLGVVVVVVGTALAVAGYWPYRTSRSSPPGQGGGGGGGGGGSGGLPDSQSGWGLGAKGLLSTASLIHSERMKLLGPVIMGVGLFILICANTVLYENRDRETQMLLAQMRNVICSVSAAVPSTDLTELAVSSLTSRHYQWVSSLPAAHLNILCLQELTSSEPLLHRKTGVVCDSDADTANEELQDRRRPSRGSVQRQGAVLRTEVVHHQESASTPSIPTLSSNSCTSSKADLKEAHADTDSPPTIGGSQGQVSLVSSPHHHHYYHRLEAAGRKLSNCLMASSMSTLEGDDWEGGASVVPTRRSQSLCYRTNPRRTPHSVTVRMEPPADDDDHSDGHSAELGVPKESASEVHVNMGDETIEIPLIEEQRHCSWPRLDLGYARRYLKLENKEDSVDKLLDQLEQQCSQWDKSFGSGPFQ